MNSWQRVMSATNDIIMENTVDERRQLWQPLAITHVEYPVGDLFGKLLAVVSLSPLIIIVGFSTLVLFRRDLHTITFLVGILFSELINWLLKHTIREPRPCRDREVLYTEYGMPSSHAQFMWFLAVYILLFIAFRLHANYSSAIDNAWKYLVVISTFTAAFSVSYSRIYLQYHSVMQVLCGAFVGMVLAGIWFLVTQLLLTPLFPMVASWSICEFLMIRDSTLIPNVMWFEYTSHRTEMRMRHRKIALLKS